MTRKDNELGVSEAEMAQGEVQPPPRAPYEPPRILSIEALEAVAAACEPEDAVFGKDYPVSCANAQS